MDNKVTKRDITDRVLNIVGLCMDINNLEERSVEVSGNKPAVFFDYSPHINAISVKLFENGWSGKEYNFSEYLANMLILKKNKTTADTLDAVIHRLSQILKECL